MNGEIKKTTEEGMYESEYNLENRKIYNLSNGLNFIKELLSTDNLYGEIFYMKLPFDNMIRFSSIDQRYRAIKFINVEINEDDNKLIKSIKTKFKISDYYKDKLTEEELLNNRIVPRMFIQKVANDKYKLFRLITLDLLCYKNE